MNDSSWLVPLSDVEGDDELVAAVTAAVRSGWWSAGPRVAEFERAFGEFTGAKHVMAVSSCTAALHLALLALSVGPGDEVVTPSLSFVAVANVIRLTGATPVFCDIGGESDLNLDIADLERALTPRTKAIVPLHYGGFPCEMRDVLSIAESAGVPVVEDAAHAVGASTLGRHCGTLGTVGTYSFFSNKNLPVGEGGALVTDNDDIAARVRLLRSHGMTSLTWDRHRGHASSYDVLEPGLNYRFDELRAAMAQVQLERLDRATAERRRLADRYVELLEGRFGLRVAFADRSDRADAAHHLAVVVLPAGIDRDELRATLAGRRIQTSVHYPPIHRFRAHLQRPSRALPQLDAVADRLLTLPLFPSLGDERQDVVVEELCSALQDGGAASAWG